MRTKLKPFENFRMNFIATFEKFGENYVSGNKYSTILFTDIKNTFGDLLSDHIWIRDIKEFKKFNPQKNDVFSFSGVVKRYKHGYYLDNIEYDYKIIYIKNVKKLK